MSAATLVEFKLPDVGEGLSEAEIIEWLVRPGDTVKADQPAVIVNTDKATVEIPSPVSGTVRECVGKPGEKLPTGSVLMRIETGASASGVTATDEPSEPFARKLVLAAASTRQLATKLGVDLATVVGTGPGGRVLSADVLGAAGGSTSPVPAPPVVAALESTEEETIPLRGLRKQTALAVTHAWRTIPHITEFREIDASALAGAQRALRDRLATEGLKLTYFPLFVRAVALALAKHPSFNALLDMERELIVKRRTRDIGIAIATEEGLVAPVLRAADTLKLRPLVSALDGLIERGRTRRIAQSESGAASVTITNFGSYGTWLGTPIVRAPESAIVGFGRIHDAVIAVDGVPAVRPVLPIAIAADHRLNDGEQLAGFAATIAVLLAQPVLLFDDGP